MSRKNRIKDIARLLTEDPDVFSAYMDAWKRETVLELSDFHLVAGILKEVAAENGCELDVGRLTVKLIPAGFVMKNIYLNCPDFEKQKELATRLADQSEDFKPHSFAHDLRVNLYRAINKEFAEKVREQGLDVSHQYMGISPNSKLKKRDILPMATIVKVDKELEEPDVQDDLSELGDLSLDLEPEAQEAPGETEEQGDEELEQPPMGGPAQPIEPDEEEIEFEETIARISNLITEDPNITLNGF